MIARRFNGARSQGSFKNNEGGALVAQVTAEMTGIGFPQDGVEVRTRWNLQKQHTFEGILCLGKR